MDPKQAISFLSRFAPCPHDNYDANLGNGTTWGKCEDCGVTFLVEHLPRTRKACEDFDAAITCLSDLVANQETLIKAVKYGALVLSGEELTKRNLEKALEMARTAIMKTGGQQ